MAKRVQRLAVFLVAVFSLTLLAMPAHASEPTIELTLFRAVRISNDTIALSFITSREAIASVTYTGISERTISLTDTAPQVDHLFTIEDLNPSNAYSFSIIADQGGDTSNTYVVLLTPQSIGGPGASITPGVQMLDSSGKLVGAQLAASTTPLDTNLKPTIIGICIVAFGFGAWLIYSYLRKKRILVPIDHAL